MWVKQWDQVSSIKKYMKNNCYETIYVAIND